MAHLPLPVCDVVAVKSIDYDVDLDFLLDIPEQSDLSATSATPRDSSSAVNGSLQQATTSASSRRADVDCLITPDRPPRHSNTPVGITDRPGSTVPSVDRSTKPTSSTRQSADTRTTAGSSSSVNDSTAVSSVRDGQVTMNGVSVTSKPSAEGRPTVNSGSVSSKPSVEGRPADVPVDSATAEHSNKPLRVATAAAVATATPPQPRSVVPPTPDRSRC